MKGLLFLTLRYITRFALWVFFRRVGVRGRELVPEDGPMMFAANHPNVLLDILLVGSYIPRTIPRFMGKSTLFRRPLLGALLRYLGVIPVARPQDRGEKLASNRDMFRNAVETLLRGRSLVVFPEGISHPLQQVKALKPGAARIALQTAADPEAPAGFKVIPVGLTYEDPGVFRSDAVVHFGDPIDPFDLLPLWRENPHEAEHRLTAVLHERLKSLTRHVDDPTMEDILRDAWAVYGERLAEEVGDSDGLTARLRADQGITRAAEHFKTTDPDQVNAIARRLRAHMQTIRRLGLEPGVFQKGFQTGVLALTATIILAPVALAGLIANAIPYYLPRLFVPPYRKEPEMIGTVKLSAGSAAFLAYYAVMYVVLHALAGPGAAPWLLVAMPVAGIVTIFYHEQLLSRWPLWRRGIAPSGRRYLLGRLAGERAALVRELDALKERYLRESGTQG